MRFIVLAKAFAILGALLFAQSVVFAQDSTPKQVVVIDIDALFDEEKGIPELAEISKVLQVEFKSDIEKLKVMFEPIDKLQKELAEYGNMDFKGACPPSDLGREIDAKLKKLEELQSADNESYSAFRNRYRLSRNQKAKPILGDSVAQFKKRFGYADVVEKTSLEDRPIEDNLVDVTNEFMPFFAKE